MVGGVFFEDGNDLTQVCRYIVGVSSKRARIGAINTVFVVLPIEVEFAQLLVKRIGESL